MRFLHLADLHLGRTVNEFRMIGDQKYILRQILKIAEDKHVDAVLIAGDVYDKSIPSEDAVRLLDRFLYELAESNITVIMIAGNHDSDVRLDFGSSFFSAGNIYITGSYQGKVPHVTLHDAYGPVTFWSLPFVKASHAAHYHPDADITDYDKAVRTALSRCELNPKERNVLLAHQFVTGGSHDPESSGSENTLPGQVGAVEKVDASAFDTFDYTALGHIHRPQKIMRDTVRYAGSPLKYSLSETGYTKSVPLVVMKEKNDVTVELIPLKPLRDMRHIKGTMAQILDAKNVSDTEDYIYVTLTDEETIPDAMSRIRMIYPNIMKLDYQNSHTASIENGVMEDVIQSSFHEQMSSFYHLFENDEPNEEEWKILEEAAKEAGVSDETD